jgi:tetratricopeptide (TPR) repeat protein
LDPKFTVAYSNRGFVNFKLGDYAGALADFKKVLELDPQNADARKSIEVIEKTQKQGDSQ